MAMQFDPMAGSALREIRKALGWTLAQMAEQLGMSETYVGQMERDQKPIERRTELAARYLALTGGRDLVAVPRFDSLEKFDEHLRDGGD